ncbi:MAG: glycosyltransferase [Bacteroidota bacterium]
MGAHVKAKSRLVLSGINFFEGGPLSLMRDCLSYLENSCYGHSHDIIALVSEVKFYIDLNLKNITLFEYPSSRRSYFKRLYYEYFVFKKFARENKIHFWISMHDITPSLAGIPQAVYCHNPAPFYNPSLREFFFEPSLGLFSYFYKFIYRTNIHRNNYVIVQQEWLRDSFCKLYSVSKQKIIVAHPSINITPEKENKRNGKVKVFVYPTLSRVFKNVELIGEAVIVLNKRGIENYKVVITIDGTENRYSQWLRKKFRDLPNLHFIGKQSRDKVFDLYYQADCLIFPSKLETWGMPISEFKATGKYILLADLPYAHETLGDYTKSCFFNPMSKIDLANKMGSLILEKPFTYNHESKIIEYPFAHDWQELFKILLAS